MLCVDHEGKAVDGDQIIAILARDLHQRGTLPEPGGGHVDDHLGFHRAMGELGIERRTDVGDRYVLAAMREHGLDSVASSPAT